MDLNVSESPAAPLRVALDFSFRIEQQRALALDGLRAELKKMNEPQVRQCAEHLCVLLAEEEGSAQVLSAVFGVLESLPPRT